MTVRAFRFGVALSAAASLLGACSGTSGSALPAAGGTYDAAASQPEAAPRNAMRIVIPAIPESGSFALPRLRDGRRNPYFTAITTRGIDVRVTAAGGSSVLGETKAGLGPESPYCVAQHSGGRLCIVPIPVPPGDDRFAVATYDAAPAGGSFARARLLAADSFERQISPGSANMFTITLGGVVRALRLDVPLAQLHGTVASSQTLGVYALDADGNVIVSDGYYDDRALPLSLSLTLGTPRGPHGGEFALSTTSLASPSPSGVSLSYDGLASIPADGLSGAFATTISVNAARDGEGRATGIAPSVKSVALIGPSVVEYPVRAGGRPRELALGPDGNIWFTDPATNAVGKIAPTGLSVERRLSLPRARPNGIAAGADGKLWFTAAGSGDIGTIDPASDRVTFYPKAIGPLEIAAAADGTLWFTEPSNNTLAKIDTQGRITRFPPLRRANSVPSYLSAGPGGTMWFTQPGAGRIGVANAAGSVIAQYRVQGPGKAAGPDEINGGPGGSLWSVNTIAGTVNVVTPAGSQRTFAPVGKNPGDIVEGPDGNLWISTSTGFLVRMTPAGAVRPYRIASGTAASLGAIVVGSDGNLWFADSRGKIGRFVW